MVWSYDIMTLMLQTVQTSCSPHLAYSESLLRRLACPGEWYLEISWSHATQYMWKFETTRPIGELFTGHFACNHAIGSNANWTVKGVPIFEEGNPKKLLARYYALLPSVCVQNFGLIVIYTTRIIFFPNSRWPQWKRSIMACHGKSTVQISCDKLF